VRIAGRLSLRACLPAKRPAGIIGCGACPSLAAACLARSPPSRPQRHVSGAGADPAGFVEIIDPLLQCGRGAGPVHGVPCRAAVASRAIALLAVLQARGDLRPLSGRQVVDPEITARGQCRCRTRKFSTEIVFGVIGFKEIRRRHKIADQNPVFHIRDAVVLHSIAYFADALAAVRKVDEGIGRRVARHFQKLVGQVDGPRDAISLIVRGEDLTLDATMRVQVIAERTRVVRMI